MALDAIHAQAYSKYLVGSLRKELVYANLVSRSPYEDEIAGKGSVLHIGSIGDVTVRNFSKGTDITIEELSSAETVLNIDQDKYFAFYLYETDLAKIAQGRLEVLEGRISQSGYNLSDEADQYIANALAADAGSVVDNSGSAYTVTSSNAYSLLLKLSTALTNKKVPRRDRWCVISPAYAELLKQDEKFAKPSDEAFKQISVEGYVGKVDGMQVFESVNFSTTNDRRIVAGHKMAGVYAEAINGLRSDWDVRKMAEAVVGHHLYGYLTVRPDCVAALRSDV